MDLPLVSAIIPAYNAEQFIARTLSSVIEQTYKNLEILVVDDGSKDRTAEIVEQFATKDSRVTLLRQQNSGVAKARNLAIENARGEYIAPIDADDLWHPEKIAKQVDKIVNSSISVGLIYCWSISIDLEDYIIRRFSNKYLISFNSPEGNVLQALIYRNFIGNSSSPLITRSCLEKVGLYNYHLHQQNAQGCEDWDLYLKIAEHYEFAVVPEFLVGYRGLPNSMSSNVNTMEKSYKLVFSNFQNRHPEVPPWVYRYSYSNFYVYLVGKSISNKDINLTLTYIFNIIQLDIFFCLSTKIYKLFWRILLLKITGDLKTRNNNLKVQAKFPNEIEIEMVKSIVHKDIIYNLILKRRLQKLIDN